MSGKILVDTTSVDDLIHQNGGKGFSQGANMTVGSLGVVLWLIETEPQENNSVVQLIIIICNQQTNLWRVVAHVYQAEIYRHLREVI